MNVCPYCKDQGFKSILRIGKGASSGFPFSPYYDEDGRYHAHDPNLHSVEYRCSLGHHFIVKEKRRCPSCAFPPDAAETVTRIT